MTRTSRSAIAIALLASTALFGCGSPTAPSPAGPAQAPLQTLELQPRPAPLERRLDGTVEAVNQGTVASQTSGRVTEVLYDVNDFVPAGAVIVRLRGTEQRSGVLQAEAALHEADARDKEARARYERAALMFERNLVAKAALDEATASRDAAAARLKAAQAGLTSAREGMAYTEIRAPYAGIVTQRHIEVGESVSPGTPLMSGLSLRYLRVVVDVPQSLIEQVRRIRKGAVYIDGRRIDATKLTIFPQASTPSNTFRARLELPENAADLYPGMFVKVAFVTGEVARLLVPAHCVEERGEVTSVYVVGAGGDVSLRQVRLGHRLDDQVEVLAGLAAGDRIALDPALARQRLRAPAA